MEIVVIALLILFNGVLSMTEMAFVSSRKFKAEADDRFLSTIQIGITLISILTGMFSGDKLADDFAAVLVSWKWLAPHAHWVAKVIIVTVVTYLSLVIGELIPKRIGMGASDKVAKGMRGFMTFLRKITQPFVWLLSVSTQGILHLFGARNLGEEKVTEDEIKALINEGKEDGEIEEVEQELVGRVFNLSDRTVDTIMTHRSDLQWLDINDPVDALLTQVQENLHGIYPVADGELDEIKGVVYMKDLFGKIGAPSFDLMSVTTPALFLPENLSVYAAVEQIKNHYSKYALIIDEFGSIQGMVTHSDIMEALIGQLPESKEDHDIVARDDGSFLVDGQCDFFAFLQFFDKEDLAHDNDYNTLSGLILDKLEHVPTTGEKLQWEGFSIEVVDMDVARIDKVLVKSISQN